ncbi:hypothetical protein AXK11_03535 [Cephaloticoccus primus]|uniref:Mandelate racemase/muconate lactonizing enzyme C-terminal domain-containing protein n=1 Tax=Cephaloticoccus primus TaxID=1548207 RepID=A0A139SPY5_9BACT|nr:hypothetical protein AXK11_03535 [Cephaloticoccus primus]
MQRLIGRRAPAPLPDTSSREVAALLPAGRAAVDAMRDRRAAGFRTFKWKVGVASDPAEELDILDELCAELPTEAAAGARPARLRLDANGGWDQRTAERWLERCAELGSKIEFIEQPVWAGPGASAREQRRTEDVLLGLSADYPTALALDESLLGDGDVHGWLERGWQGVFVVKPTLLAEPATVLAELARADARVVFSSALETAVGAKEALRWAFAWETRARREGQQGREKRAGARQTEPYALGFGVWPLFAEAALNGPCASPFLSREAVEAINSEAAWNALS